jgi:hypothetical protein
MSIERLLLVEGRDDFHFVKQFGAAFKLEVIEHFRVGPDDKPIDLGWEAVLNEAAVRIKGSEPPSALGILLDADVNPQTRWQSISTVLKRVGISALPAAPDPAGVIIETPGLPKVGIWLMPDNVQTGMLEDLFLSFIPADDPSLVYAYACVTDIPAAAKRFADKDISKAKVCTFLAIQEIPGQPMGLAMKKKAVVPTGPVAQNFMKWLQGLFG